MVRVISVHNFPKQDISSAEVIDLTTVPPDILLLAQSDNTISVRDLSGTDEAGYVIPTVDAVVKVIYSMRGNYIGTLERKLARNGVDVLHIRIYLNWESLKYCKEYPPMRARIAGRVTPLSQSHEGLEMIEIPVEYIPENMVCCPVHDISKIYFVDFEQMPFECTISFVPTRIRLLENMVAVQNDEYLHVFNIHIIADSSHGAHAGCQRLVDHQPEKSITCTRRTRPSGCNAINYEKLLMENSGLMSKKEGFKKLNNPLVSSGVNGNVQADTELRKINYLSFPLKHDFPTIVMGKTFESNRPDVQKQNPFLTGHDLRVNVIAKHCRQNWDFQIEVEDLLQYRVMPLMVGSATNSVIQEKYTCLILKPFYSSNATSVLPKGSGSLESNHFGRLTTVLCFFGTQQEGYLYRFDYCNGGLKGGPESWTVYPFTAPVIDVQMEDYFVHALTDAGLETYTMRVSECFNTNSDIGVYTTRNDPVCLVGLRPFVNVFKMCITNEKLILFANSEDSSSLGIWTMYKLQLPGPCSVWTDFLSAAEENKWESPATYCHLVSEGHLILKTYLSYAKWISQTEGPESRVYNAVEVINDGERNSAEKLFRESCALLGDFYTINNEASKASHYYAMSGFKMCDISRRVECLAGEISTKSGSNYDENAIRRCFVYHLKKTLYSYDEKYASFPGNREEFYAPEIVSTASILLDCLEKEGNPSMSDLILNSVVLREFATDRILKMMKNILSTSSPPKEKDALTLAVMCIQRGQVEQAKTVLLTISPKRLEDMLRGHFHLLLEENNVTKLKSFTELCMVLIETYPLVVGRILSYYVTEKRHLNLTNLLKIFLDILPSGTVKSKNSSVVLQIVLENFFNEDTTASGRACDLKSSEGLKILLRIYLTFLKQKISCNWKSFVESETFCKYRRPYLDWVPPFVTAEAHVSPPKDDTKRYDTALEKCLKCTLRKIQGLLSMDNLPAECISEVRNFLRNQSDVYGALSLQVLSAATIQEATELLIVSAPHAILYYVKDCVRDVQDWKFAIKYVKGKMDSTTNDSEIKFNYRKILDDLLSLAARSLDIEDLLDVLPQDLEDGEKFLTMAQNNAQGYHIRTLIMTTGKQLETTLYDVIAERSDPFHATQNSAM